MLGLILTEEQVAWTDDGEVVHRGIVITLSDDELWAAVCELDQDEIIELPTSLLYPIQ